MESMDTYADEGLVLNKLGVVKANDSAWDSLIEKLNKISGQQVLHVDMSLVAVMSALDDEYGDVCVSVIKSAFDVYPLPEYGWDGGEPINTETLNLEVVSTTDIGGGPTASIVKLKDQLMPGVSIHDARENGFYIILYI
jgi:hypothetical protein